MKLSVSNFMKTRLITLDIFCANSQTDKRKGENATLLLVSPVLYAWPSLALDIEGT